MEDEEIINELKRLYGKEFVGIEIRDKYSITVCLKDPDRELTFLKKVKK